MNRTKHFVRHLTLLEMLLAIFIIAILLSLFFAGFKHARKAKNDTICIAQLRQFNISSALFLNANRQSFPGIVRGAEDSNYGRCWIGKNGTSLWGSKVTDRPLNAYLGYVTNGAEVPIAKCPYNDETFDAYNGVGTSYAGNSVDNAWDSLNNLRLSSLQNPGRTILGMEMGGWLMLYSLTHQLGREWFMARARRLHIV